MTFITVLGRQPELGLAELERLYGAEHVTRFSPSTALVETDAIDVQRLGGSIKAGAVTIRLEKMTWPDLNKKVARHFHGAWRHRTGKQTLGISLYDQETSPRNVQGLGLDIKKRLKADGVSLRLIPNAETVLSSATSHHNKLGLSPNKTELLIVRGFDDTYVVAESVGAQNISALAARDQGRPKRDAFVGMLPPKLALLMINLAHPRPHSRLLDPFCGTGVVLQEAALLGHDVYGTDLSEKMVDYSTENLTWLTRKYRLGTDITIHHGDATDTTWQQPVDAVVAETYLGQPFSAPPSPEKLAQVRRTCDGIISAFLRNLAPQITPGTSLCLAVPTWRATDGRLTHLPLIGKLDTFGYELVTLSHADSDQLVYAREDQVVARQLLILSRK